MSVTTAGMEARATRPSAGNPSDAYDDDLAWILQRLTERAGGRFGLLVRYIDSEPDGLVLACHDPEAALTPGCRDQLAAALAARGPERGVTSEEELQRETLSIGPERSVRVLFMRFALSAGVSIVACVGQPAASMTLLQDLVARRLRPVLQRYLRLWWMHRTERRRAAALAAAADHGEVALALLDRRGYVNFANAAAGRLLLPGGESRLFTCNGGGTHSGDVARLQAAIQHALIFNSLGRPLAEFRAPIVALRRHGLRALIVLAMPLERPAMDADDPAVVIYALDPASETPQQLAPAFRIYALTPAESRLVSHLVRGHSLAESAGAMNVGVPTARSYLKKVFQKTDTNRQSDLIRLMLSSAVRSRVGLDLSLLGE